MRAIKVFLLGVTAVTVAVLASLMVFKSEPTSPAERGKNQGSVVQFVPEQSTPPALTPELTPESSNSGVSSSAEPARAVEPAARSKTSPAPNKAKKPKEPLHDPVARVAMSFVGVDPEAESYWLEAIFDSSLPDKEREDLMEDLNEEGLSDHKHPGPQDLPVILNRLTIIEELLPHADEFMVTHLGEAYKDLLNLAEITQGGGVPVR